MPTCSPGCVLTVATTRHTGAAIVTPVWPLGAANEPAGTVVADEMAVFGIDAARAADDSPSQVAAEAP